MESFILVVLLPIQLIAALPAPSKKVQDTALHQIGFTILCIAADNISLVAL